MATVNFYCLTSLPVEKVLPAVLEKVLAGGHRALVLTSSEQRTKTIDDVLWTYSQSKFLPHGTANDNLPHEHPIFIANKEVSSNEPDVLVLVESFSVPKNNNYSRYVVMVDTHKPQELDQAKTLWKHFETSNNQITCWRQDDAGKWLESTLN